MSSNILIIFNFTFEGVKTFGVIVRTVRVCAGRVRIVSPNERICMQNYKTQLGRGTKKSTHLLCLIVYFTGGYSFSPHQINPATLRQPTPPPPSTVLMKILVAHIFQNPAPLLFIILLFRIVNVYYLDVVLIIQIKY